MKCDAIVVGGGPAGVITALTAKNVYPEKSVGRRVSQCGGARRSEESDRT
jgi:flavin-dependent dehydrogenase